MFQMDRLHVDIMHPSGKSVRLNTPETFSAHENIQPGASYNVAHLYALFAQQLAGNKIDVPDFHHAFHMHKLLDVIRNASKTGTWQSVNLPE